MKLPSVQHVAHDAGRAFRRFPVVLIAAMLGTAASLVLIDTEEARSFLFLYNVLFASVPGIPLLAALALTAEKEGMRPAGAILLQAGGVLLLALYAISLPPDIPAAPAFHGARLAVLAVGMVFLVTVLPFLRTGETNGFWQYNKALALRLVTSGIFTAVLYIGLSIALAALDNLFGMHIPGKRYGELGVLLLGVFGTWFFLAGVPSDLHALDRETDYPKAVRIFAQYIVFPIALVYLVILYAYMGKILIEWDWPRGWVSKLVLGFAATGTFSLLLLHPVRDTAGSVWIRSAARWYHILLLPLVGMLFLAVWRRISEYGVTEGRYLALALGAWCVVMVVFHFLGRGRSIKAVPLSLFLLAIAVSYGPWSAFAVPERDQIARLERLLTRAGLLSGGRIVTPAHAVPYEDAREISSMLAYLGAMHGYDGIQPWFTQNLRSESPTAEGGYKTPEAVAKLMGIDFVRGWEAAESEEVTFETSKGIPLSVAGYDGLLPARQFNPRMPGRDDPESGLILRAGEDLSTLTLYLTSGGRRIDSARADMRAFAERLSRGYAHRDTRAVHPDSMAVTVRGGRMTARIFAEMLGVRRESGKATPTFYHAGAVIRMDAADPAPEPAR